MVPSLPAAPSLRLRAVRIDTDAENVAYLARGCAACRIDALRAAAKVAIRPFDAPASAESLLAVLNIVDDPSIVGPDEIGLSEQAFALIGLPAGAALRVVERQVPKSVVNVFGLFSTVLYRLNTMHMVLKQMIL